MAEIQQVEFNLVDTRISILNDNFNIYNEILKYFR